MPEGAGGLVRQRLNPVVHVWVRIDRDVSALGTGKVHERADRRAVYTETKWKKGSCSRAGVRRKRAPAIVFLATTAKSLLPAEANRVAAIAYTLLCRALFCESFAASS